MYSPLGKGNSVPSPKKRSIVFRFRASPHTLLEQRTTQRPTLALRRPERPPPMPSHHPQNTTTGTHAHVCQPQTARAIADNFKASLRVQLVVLDFGSVYCPNANTPNHPGVTVEDCSARSAKRPPWKPRSGSWHHGGDLDFVPASDCWRGDAAGRRIRSAGEGHGRYRAFLDPRTPGPDPPLESKGKGLLLLGQSRPLPSSISYQSSPGESRAERGNRTHAALLIELDAPRRRYHGDCARRTRRSAAPDCATVLKRTGWVRGEAL